MRRFELGPKKKDTISGPFGLVLKYDLLRRLGLLASLCISLLLIILLVDNLLSTVGIKRYIPLAKDFIFASSSELRSSEGRVNVLILGKGGVSHDAPDLTDTIILASMSLEDQKTTLISLPRDIWIPEIRAKINSAYYWGKQKNVGGLTYVKPLITEIIGQPVEYGVVIDFSGFKEIIDILGGIDVNVERSFVDEEFPIPGRENDLCDGDKTFKCRYQTVSFKKGLQHMDGTTALNFVRSRHAEGDEGTDFARDARQQKVIVAIKEKMLKPVTYFSLEKTSALLKVFEKSVETDIDGKTGAVLARYALKSKNNIVNQVLPESLLINPPASSKYDYQYVFIPKAKDWSEVQKWIGENLP